MIERELTKKLADLGARIEARLADLRERGDFSTVHAAAFADIEARRAAIETRMEKLVSGSDLGAAATTELARDVDALVDGFEAAVFSIDARAVRAG